jgi:regulator of protease activity HflC (stomatin/prohibitin superfamily)
VLLRSVRIGKVDLPADYRAGIEQLMAEELASEKMRFTLELKRKQVTESALQAEADKQRRETAAQAAAAEQVIAARAQQEAMRHVLPFKQQQIEQRRLEAEAHKLARIKQAEAAAQARRIEADGEAASRQALADAEVYRLEKVGRATSEQMAREGALITRHPLLIQKTLADKLSDKVQVIIAPPPAGGGFIGETLLGQTAPARAGAVAHAEGEE